MREKRTRFGLPAVGGSSLLVMFAVLCLTVFALLALSTVQADGRLSAAATESVKAYYEADCRAEEIYARLRAGELPPEVTPCNCPGEGYAYACPISETQRLRVELHHDETGWTVLRWQAESTVSWETDETLDLWDGT